MPFRQRPQHSLKLRNMIIVLMVCFLTLMLAGFIIILKISLSRLETYFQSSSNYIFEQETDRQLKYYLEMYQTRLRQVIRSGNTTLQSIQLLYNEIQAKEASIHTQTLPEYSLRPSAINEYNQKQFGILSVLPLDPIKYAPFFNLTSLLNEYLYQFGFFDMKTTQYVYYVDVNPEQFYFQYPVDNEEGYIPQSYELYVKYLQMNEANALLPPYLSWDEGPIVMSIYQSMFNLNKSLEGVLSLDFTFYEIESQLHTYFIIVNQNGILLTVNGAYTNATLPLFNNTDITGFNQSDWDTIMNSPQTKVHNSLLNSDVYVRQKHWISDQFILLTYQDVSPYQLQQEIIMDQLYDFTGRLQNSYYVFLFGAILICLVFQFMMIYKIVEPLTNFTRLLKSQIYLISQNDIKKSFIEQIRFKKLKTQPQIFNLYCQLVQASRRSHHSKSKQCYIFERFKFPKKNPQKRSQFNSKNELQDGVEILLIPEILGLITIKHY